MHRHLAAALLVAAPATAQDLRPPTDPISPHVRGTWEAFAAGSPGRLWPTFDPRTGRLREARGHLRIAPNGIDEWNAGAAGRLVVRRLAPALGVAAGDLAERGVLSARGGLFHVAFQQELGGVPVEGATVSLRFSAAGDLMSLKSSTLLRDASLATRPEVTPGEAAELARVGLPGATDRADAWRPRLVVLPEDGGTLAWSVVVSDEALSPSDWHVWIDAQSGVLLRHADGLVGADVSGKSQGWGTPSGTMEHHPETLLPLTNQRVRLTDWSNALYKLSNDGTDESLVSGDGSRVFWTTDADGDLEIWTQLVDGATPTQLLANESDEYDLATTYGGETLWFTSEASGDPEIWRVNSDGTGLAQVTFDPGIDRGVSALRDGSRIFWESDRDGDFEIFALDTAGGAPTQLTTNSLYDAHVVAAGDGGKLAFLSGTSPGDAMVWAMEPDGSSPLQLVFGPGFCDDPSITNDGGVVWFERWRRAEANVFQGEPGGLHGALGGFATHAPTVWAAATDGGSLDSFAEVVTSYQIDPCVAGDGEFVVWSERTDVGGLEVVHMELATRADVRVPSPGAAVRASLSDDGRVGGLSDDGLYLVDLRLPGTGSFDVFTDLVGDYGPAPFQDGATITVAASLSGRHVWVEDVYPKQKDLYEVEGATVPDADADLLFNAGGTHPLQTPQVTAYVQHSQVHDFLDLSYGGLGYPSPRPFDEPLLATVNYWNAAYAAAYNSIKKRTEFAIGRGKEQPNSCFDTVVFHEYGHYVDDRFGATLGLGGTDRPGDPWEHSAACTEALGDWVSMLTSGTSIIGENFYGTGKWMRNYDVPLAEKGHSDRQWDCLDCVKIEDDLNGNALRWEQYQHAQALAGFAKDLRTFAGVAAAKQILLDVIALHPDDMRDAVHAAFDVDAVFNGGANFDSICQAARRHGFDCPGRPDFASHGCTFLDWCGPFEAVHIDTGPESLGLFTDSEPACEFPDGDEDGVFLPGDVFDSEELVDVDILVSVDPKLLKSGRYGGLHWDETTKNALHYLYLNAWILLDDGGTLSVSKVLGTGSGGTSNGPFPGDTFAIDPDTEWGELAAKIYPVQIKMPKSTYLAAAILRVRLDYGEDGGRPDLLALNPLNDPLYFGDCGSARSGEVEEYQVLIVPPGG